MAIQKKSALSTAKAVEGKSHTEANPFTSESRKNKELKVKTANVNTLCTGRHIA